MLVLDPATFQIKDQIHVGRDPTGVVASGNGIWVTDPGSGTVSEINPGSDTVVATVMVAASPSAIAAGAGRLWVADASDGALTRIDPERAAVTGVINVGQPITGVTVGAGSVWVISASSGQLIGIDPQSGRVSETVPIGQGAASVQVVNGTVWVADPSDDALARFASATGRVRQLAVPDPTGLAVAAGALWVASSAPAALRRVGPATGTITSTAAMANPAAAMVGVGRALALVTLASASSHQGGTLRVVAGGGVDSIDPGAAYSANDWQLLSMSYDGLLTYARSPHPGSAALVPDLATSLPFVQDAGRTFTFKLRLGFFGWAADFPAGSAFFEPLFSCAAYQPGRPFNMNPAGFCDQQIDRQVATATTLQTTNAAAANRAWQHIDYEIMQHTPWIPLVNPLGIDLVSARVGNYQRIPEFGVPLDQLWIQN